MTEQKHWPGRKEGDQLHSRSVPVSRIATPESLERRDCPAAFSLTPIAGAVVEGEAAEFQITMAAQSMIPQAVIVSTEAGTATLGTDYMHRTQKITFFPGETVKTFRVQTLRDPIEVTEGAETVQVIVSPIAGTPTRLTATLTIDDYTPPAQFEITFDFANDVPQSVITASALAAQRWTEIIVGDLPNVIDPTHGEIDDILITVQMGLLPDFSSDGDGNTLANAGPTAWRDGGTGLPYLAAVGIDPADSDRADLTSVLIHEFAHALGFPGTDSFQSYIEGAYFVGANAVREYRAIFGAAADPAGVPMEEGGGEGTAYGHWSEDVFGNELLTGFITPGGNPLSRITVGAFADIGYTVDYAAADPYSPPAAAPAVVAVPPPAAAPTPAVIATKQGSPVTQQGPSWEFVATRRHLPARITFPDRPPVILADTAAARDLVRTSLANESSGEVVTGLDLRGLSTDRKALLAVWAAYGQPASVASQASLGALFASQAADTGKPASSRMGPVRA
jgi:hypothetical protein